MPKLIRVLEEVHRKALFSSTHQIVLNWGSLGTGKKFASFYFNEKHLQRLFPKFDGEIFHIYVRLPKRWRCGSQTIF